MPYTIAWHPDLAALVVQYQGHVSATEYRRMCAERAERLAEASSDAVAVVMDMRELADFPSARLAGEENVLDYDNVRYVLIVPDGELYKKIAASVVPDAEQRWPVRFFPTVEQALDFVREQRA